MTQFAYTQHWHSIWSSMPHGCGDTPKQDRRLVGHGLDASRELFLPRYDAQERLVARVMPWPPRGHPYIVRRNVHALTAMDRGEL